MYLSFLLNMYLSWFNFLGIIKSVKFIGRFSKSIFSAFININRMLAVMFYKTRVPGYDLAFVLTSRHSWNDILRLKPNRLLIIDFY